MNVSLALTSALYGATVVNHLQVTGLEKDQNGRLIGAKARDLIPVKDSRESPEFSIRAKVVPFTHVQQTHLNKIRVSSMRQALSRTQ